MKTKLLLKQALLLGATFMSLQAAAQWSRIASIYNGTLANDGAFSFTIGNKGYVGAGSQSNALFEYDASSNTWTPIKGLIPASMGHSFAMSFTIGNKAYVVGGDSSGYTVASVYMYDQGTGTWTRMHDFPIGKRDAGFAFSIGGYGYVGGGFDGTSIYSDIWKYDPASDSWAKEPNDLPVSGVIFPGSFVINNKAYILLGGTAPSGVNEINSMWEFDPAAGNLTPKANFPGIARQAAFTFSNSSYGYAGGGQANYTTNYNDMYRYDAANDKWTKVENAPLLGAAWSSAFVINNNAYVGLGAKFTSSGLTGVDSFYAYTMASATSVNELSNASNEGVAYPNPAKDILYFKTSTLLEGSLRVYDVSGKRVVETPVDSKKGISISALPNGMYFYEISSEKTSILIRGKFAVNH